LKGCGRVVLFAKLALNRTGTEARLLFGTGRAWKV
jgi:hypothetical protein